MLENRGGEWEVQGEGYRLAVSFFLPLSGRCRGSDVPFVVCDGLSFAELLHSYETTCSCEITAFITSF